MAHSTSPTSTLFHPSLNYHNTHHQHPHLFGRGSIVGQTIHRSRVPSFHEYPARHSVSSVRTPDSAYYPTTNPAASYFTSTGSSPVSTPSYSPQQTTSASLIPGFHRPSSSSSSRPGITLPSLPSLPRIRSPVGAYSSSFSQRTPTPPPAAYHYPNLDKMTMATVVAPHPGELPKIAGSMTTKEWVIPPRPKPGRKPATDTPPTKRKAQNRAAQRAFRERRAARVGELEEQLDEQKAENDKKDEERVKRIHELEMELQSFKSRCQLLEGLLDRERSDRVKSETEVEGLRRKLDEEVTRRSNSNAHVQLPSISSQPHLSHNPTVNSGMDDPNAALTCGSCDVNGRCACAEEIVKSVESGCGKCGPGKSCDCFDDAIKATASDLKRAPSPSLNGPAGKKRKPSDRGEETEIDFTFMFKKSQPQQQQQQSATTAPSGDHVKDPCGFCKEGDYCICADTSLAPAAPAPAPSYNVSYSQQTQTPPPSETDVVLPPMPMEINSDGAVKLPPRIRGPAAATLSSAAPQARAQASRGCGPGGPGTCAQCVADPISGLFCRALSANMGQKSGGGCCGGSSGGGGCCKSKSTAATPKAPTAPKSGGGLSLSCAEAYQTLSSHRDFGKATDDIGSWLPKLRAAPAAGKALPSPSPSSRLPIEVEAASIMSVLKDFDIRFGRGL